MKTIYRGFEIHYDVLIGQFMYDSTWLKAKGMCDTFNEAKKQIDQYYIDNTRYEVFHSRVLNSITFVKREIAIDFCKFWKFDLGCIVPKIEGNRFNYDAA